MTRLNVSTYTAELAASLAVPDQVSDPDGHPQSLSRGAAGVALLHIERAAAGLGDWTTAHSWLTIAASGLITASPQANLLFGAPALAYVLHGAAAPGRYERALAKLDAQITGLTRQRLNQANNRIDRGERPSLAELDLFKGLTGLGAHLLRRHPGSEVLAEVLAYLVRLTRPLGRDDLPGWWTHEAPSGRRANRATGGHGNLSMAHGISGPLALLSLATVRGIVVDGQTDAIRRICDWTDTWRQAHPAGSWWPEVVTLEEAMTGQTRQPAPARPSWCYGTPGHARAQQLAGIALGDIDRRRHAEHALQGCLADPRQLDRITGPGLCHGWAGLLHTSRRIAATADTAALTDSVNNLTGRFPDLPSNLEPGFLSGAAGLALTLTSVATEQPITSWDACLLLDPPYDQNG
ncbi:lanthionine synthetase C family protein [Acrocarpospora catenulata]|uniref:lanthionine synthetase C family protein n=1 Tax=Acrocarpospora catenulata TaxID=2836182 RepID=UPI001BDA334C|nr:lanthionine synthetase C family protein [Acrocarpospora catenulata]